MRNEDMLQDLYDSLTVRQHDCRMSVMALLVTVKLTAYCQAEKAYGYSPQWLSASHPVNNVLIIYKKIYKTFVRTTSQHSESKQVGPSNNNANLYSGIAWFKSKREYQLPH
jgi:hypothetical protein